MMENPQTKLHLHLWSPKDKLLLSTFYFWNNETPLERSQAGVLRSLFHRVIQHWQHLIPLVFPDWAEEGLSSYTNNPPAQQYGWNFSAAQPNDQSRK
jgi:hypothetical protein